MRASALRLGLLAVACGSPGALTACRDPVLKGVEYGSMVVDHGDPPVIALDKDVDILFVIDNSGSMAEEQATLAANFGSFIEVLERPEVAANYRIGITTTDNGNPWCGGTTPEGGLLQMSSCHGRLESFVFEGATVIDAQQEACLEVCPEQWSTIELLPTTTADDSEARPRPWIESTDGVTNLPKGLTPAQAFQCVGPQGIDGCGFESPLESMWKAVRRSYRDDDPAHGFIRNHAILSIVHVTDEADCSYDHEHESIFLPEGNRVFWSDPGASSPTSAVCWNAGVTCTGGECRSANLDVDGNEVSDELADELAVLRPVRRYLDLLKELEQVKQQITPDQEVLVSVIGGVASDGSVVYQDALDDPTFQQDFGIGPGCESANGRAVPPVRLRELAEAFAVGDDRNMFSVCDSDYSAALEAVASAIAEQIRPACMPACVADTDPETPDVLDPSCVVTQEWWTADGQHQELDVPECAPGDVLPDGADVCYVAVTGDALAEYCMEHGFNLELRIVRREDVPAPRNTALTAECELSRDRKTDCPELP